MSSSYTSQVQNKNGATRITLDSEKKAFQSATTNYSSMTETKTETSSSVQSYNGSSAKIDQSDIHHATVTYSNSGRDASKQGTQKIESSLTTSHSQIPASACKAQLTESFVGGVNSQIFLSGVDQGKTQTYSHTRTTTQTQGQTLNTSDHRRFDMSRTANTDEELAKLGYVSKPARVSTVEHQRRVVDVREGQPVVVGVREGQRTVVNVNELESRIVNEKTLYGQKKIINEREIKRERSSEKRKITKEVIETENVKMNKTFEIIKEVGVPVERYVDVKYDVIVDVPIERTIQKEKIIEVVVEKPIEKTIEVVVEQEYEVPVEKIIEVPVEITKHVKVPVEKIVRKPYDVIKEQVNYKEKLIDINEHEINRYPGAQVLPTTVSYTKHDRFVEKPVFVDNIIQRDKIIHKPVQVEVPKEVVKYQKVPTYVERKVPVEKIVHKTIDVPVENKVYVNKDVFVEKPVYRENIIEKPVERVHWVEKNVLVPVEHIVEKPVFIEKIIQNPVDILVEVPVPREQVIELGRNVFSESRINVETFAERPVEKVVRVPEVKIKPREQNFNYEMTKFIEQPAQINFERKTTRFHEKPVEQLVQIPSKIERTTEKAKFVDKTRTINLENVQEKVTTVEKLIEKPVYIDKDVIKNVEHIVIKDVEVPVERIVEVEVKVAVEKPIFKEVLVEEEVIVESLVHEIDENAEQIEEFEYDDEEISRQITIRESELNKHIRENNMLKSQYTELRREFESFHVTSNSASSNENSSLRLKLMELEQQYRAVVIQRHELQRKSINRTYVKTSQLRKDPRVETLKAQLKKLIAENAALANQILKTAEQIKHQISIESTYTTKTLVSLPTTTTTTTINPAPIEITKTRPPPLNGNNFVPPTWINSYNQNNSSTFGQGQTNYINQNSSGVTFGKQSIQANGTLGGHNASSNLSFGKHSVHSTLGESQKGGVTRISLVNGLTQSSNASFTGSNVFQSSGAIQTSSSQTFHQSSSSRAFGASGSTCGQQPLRY